MPKVRIKKCKDTLVSYRKTFQPDWKLKVSSAVGQIITDKPFLNNILEPLK